MGRGGAGGIPYGYISMLDIGDWIFVYKHIHIHIHIYIYCLFPTPIAIRLFAYWFALVNAKGSKMVWIPDDAWDAQAYGYSMPQDMQYAMMMAQKGKSMDKGYGKGMDKGYGKGMDKGYEKHSKNITKI